MMQPYLSQHSDCGSYEKIAGDCCLETGNSHSLPIKATSRVKYKRGTYIRSVPSDNIQLEQVEMKRETGRERRGTWFCFKESEEMLKDETIGRAGRQTDF